MTRTHNQSSTHKPSILFGTPGRLFSLRAPLAPSILIQRAIHEPANLDSPNKSL